MVDNKYKLDFMVEILTSVVEGTWDYQCQFNYFGFERNTACGNYLPWEGYEQAQKRGRKIASVMKKILNDKVNYEKYLDDTTTKYLIAVYNEEFRRIAVKYKVTYTKSTFKKGFWSVVKKFVTAHNTFYVVGDIFGNDINNMLVAADDLTQYIPAKRDFIDYLISNADDYSFEQLNPTIKVEEKPSHVMDL